MVVLSLGLCSRSRRLSVWIDGCEARSLIDLRRLLLVVDDLPDLVVPNRSIHHGILVTKSSLLDRVLATVHQGLRIAASVVRSVVVVHALLVGVLGIGTEHAIVGHRAGRVHPHHCLGCGSFSIEGPREACQ